MNHEKATHHGSAMALPILLGAAAGAAAMLILAPRVRRESAARIRAASRALKDRAVTALDTAKEKVLSSATRGREALDERRTALETAMTAGREAWSEARSRSARAG